MQLDAEQRLLTAIIENPGASRYELSLMTGLSLEQIGSIIRRLESEGLIVRTGRLLETLGHSVTNGYTKGDRTDRG